MGGIGGRKPRRGKIRGSAAEPQVRACLEKGGTLQEAAEVFEFASGKKVSLDSMSRFARAVLAEAKEFDEVARAASVLREADDYPGCHVTVMSRKLLMLRALNAVQQLPDDAFEEMPPDKLSLVISRLERSGAFTDRNRSEANDYHAHAYAEFFANLCEELRGHRDLHRIASAAFEEAKRRQEGKPWRKVKLEVEGEKGDAGSDPPEEEKPDPDLPAAPEDPAPPIPPEDSIPPSPPYQGKDKGGVTPGQRGDEGAPFRPEGDGGDPSPRPGEGGG